MLRAEMRTEDGGVISVTSAAGQQAQRCGFDTRRHKSNH